MENVSLKILNVCLSLDSKTEASLKDLISFLNIKMLTSFKREELRILVSICCVYFGG